MKNIYNFKIKKTNSFFEKEKLFVLSMWKLTLDYGTILETSTLVDNLLALPTKATTLCLDSI